MKKFGSVILTLLTMVFSLQAQRPSECQAPDAHMNPNCNGSATPAVPPKSKFSVGGTYQLTGSSPEGDAYEGSVVITGDAQNGYQFNWTVGTNQYSGNGTLAGDTLTVDWGATEPAVYKVLKDGKQLKGKWGKRGRGREVLTRSSP